MNPRVIPLLQEQKRFDLEKTLSEHDETSVYRNGKLQGDVYFVESVKGAHISYSDSRLGYIRII